MRLMALIVCSFLAFAGCIESDSASSDAAPADSAGNNGAGENPDAEPGTEAPVEAAATAAPCKDAVNYGIMISTPNGIFYQGPNGPDDVRVYEDSNDRGGLQTEESCPDNHDARVA